MLGKHAEDNIPQICFLCIYSVENRKEIFFRCGRNVEWINVSVRLCYRAVIGEIDEDTDSALDLGNIRAEPLNSIVH